jgi:predicted DNA-binding antitoxin AbrB/MazE fold protein
MSYIIEAIYENGVLKPLEKLDLNEHQQVYLIIQTNVMAYRQESACNDLLAGVCCATGIPDLAENFCDYRFGRRKP